MVFNSGEPHAGGVTGDATWRYRGLYIADATFRDISETASERLASDAASFIVGHNLAIDGGFLSM
jgi:hypothetical protein